MWPINEHFHRLLEKIEAFQSHALHQQLSPLAGYSKGINRIGKIIKAKGSLSKHHSKASDCLRAVVVSPSLEDKNRKSGYAKELGSYKYPMHLLGSQNGHMEGAMTN